MLPQVDIRSFYLPYSNVFALFFLGTGLFIKPLFTRRIATFHLGRLMAANATMNIASTLLQKPTLYVAAIVCWFLNLLVLRPIFGTNEYPPGIWLPIVSVATVISATIDALVLRIVFTKRINPGTFSLLCMANAICMAGAIYGTHKYVLAHPPQA